MQESLFCNQKPVPPNPYTIYSASAGSGKTSTLVKEYLKIVLSHGYGGKVHQILALTFTNKAVNEMKGRILECLASFSRTENTDEAPHMFGDLCKELSLSPEELKVRSTRILKELLHNYAYFDVSTIDKFTHRLIRTFARDLKLPQNFEVVLDTDRMLEEAIARLLARAGEEPELTRLLIAFSLEKIDDDRSWDIGYDLFRVGKLLFNENHQQHIRKLEEKNLNDFGKLRECICLAIKDSEDRMRLKSSEILDSMQSGQLEETDFSRGYLPKFLKILRGGEFQKVNFDAKWKQKFDETLPYNKSCAQGTKSRIDALLPTWRVLFREIKDAFNTWGLLQNALRNLVPLAILNAIQQELALLGKERDLLPISSFNNLISQEIKGQPAPFIYERLGEKYRHYFIDEFQDTSAMQWQNLIPLIGNALESVDIAGNQGSLLLVGDAKQAIYRWRGGRAEQFLNLINGQDKPFTIGPKVVWKPSNYRSNREIVDFNNAFFSHLSESLQNPLYRDLYAKGSWQQPEKSEEGLVQLHFISPGVNSKDELFCEAILDRIREIAALNYPYSDICVLTRTRAQGVVVADYLLQQKIPIISSETLLLKNHPSIGFLIALLQYCQLPADKSAVFELLNYLSGKEDKHHFISTHLHNPAPVLLEQFGFDAGYTKHASVYDSLEYAIRVFKLAGTADAYLTFLLEEALLVEQKEDGSIPSFLTHWEEQKDSLSIVAADAMNAITLMTIHKAKGLEFPIVIYPYANTDIHGSRKDKDALMWLPVDPEGHAGFEELLLSKKKEMAEYNEAARQLYQREQEKLELDSINLLYVALTRAEKGLYVLSECDLDTGGNPRITRFSGLFIQYLSKRGDWFREQPTYTFGKLPAKHEAELDIQSGTSFPFQYSFKDRPAFRLLTKSGLLWDSGRGEAIGKGNRIHHLMAGIATREDLEPSLERLLAHGDIPQSEAGEFRQAAVRIVDHPQLSAYFDEGLIVRNETDIISSKGIILRPDRIVIQGTKATIIDYKTGKTDPSYKAQLFEYAEALESMGFEVENKIIVYINQEVKTEFI